jgi:hypothetical protein
MGRVARYKKVKSTVLNFGQEKAPTGEPIEEDFDEDRLPSAARHIVRLQKAVSNPRPKRPPVKAPPKSTRQPGESLFDYNARISAETRAILTSEFKKGSKTSAKQARRRSEIKQEKKSSKASKNDDEFLPERIKLEKEKLKNSFGIQAAAPPQLLVDTLHRQKKS